MSAEFATTSWSQVLAARAGSSTESRRALEALCATYWYPLYAYVRRQGHDSDESRDLTQAFFAHLFEKDTLQRAEPVAGRFRSFLLGSLKNFLSHERDKAQTLKRGGANNIISLDAEIAENRYGSEPVERLTPEEIYERRWAMTVVKRAMRRLREEPAPDEHPDQLTKLKAYLVGERPRVPYREVASELGMTEGAVKAAVQRLRKRFGGLLRAEIAETLADPADTDDELRHLLLVIRPFGAKRR